MSFEKWARSLGAFIGRLLKAILRGAMVMIQDVLAALEALAPLRYAEPWDNVGLIVGDPGAPVSRVLLTIDYTDEVADEARRACAELVVAYHPPLFEGIKRIHHKSLVHRAIRDGIAVYSPHTALDVAEGGTNDVLADALGIEALLVAGPLSGEVTRAAVCAGAGRSLLDDVIARGAELYVTGELPHHDALRAARAGVTVACALHSNSERAALRSLRDRLSAAAPGVTVMISEEDRDPFTVR